METSYYRRNREAVLKKQAEWKAANRELYLARRRASNARCSAERVKKAVAWATAHPEFGRARVAKRRAARLQRTPLWFGELDALVMAEAHDLARLRGPAWEVDHTIPLQGKRVSGLHVGNNVRVVPVALNRRKGNSFDVEAT